MIREFEARLRAALQLELPYPERPPTRDGTPAAVLALFAEYQGEIAVLMTRRTEKVETHKGQMAFPGGHCEPDELCGPEGQRLTALRETEEEVGIPRARVRVVGELPGIWTVTGYWVTPVAGVLEVPAESLRLANDPHEIAEAFWIPLRILAAPETYRREFLTIGAVNYPIHVYQVGEHRIWGATGSMIKNLLDRLAALG